MKRFLGVLFFISFVLLTPFFSFASENNALSFDGSDYVTIPDSSVWDFGSGNFTIDFWVNFDQLDAHTSGLQTLVHCGMDGDNNYWALMYGGGTYPTNTGIGFIDKGGAGEHFQGNQDGWQPDTWYHIAFVRDDNGYKIFRNGELILSYNYTGIHTNYNAPLLVGIAHNHREFGGYIDELRISKGVARWTQNFTVPNSPHSIDDANTALLIHSNESGGVTTFNDSSYYRHSVNINGDVKHSSTQSKFGTSSIYFNGSTDYLSLQNRSDWNFGTGDFTISFWVNHDHINQQSYLWQNGQSAIGIRWTGSQFEVWMGPPFTANTYNAQIEIDQWYHISLVGQGGNTVRFYLNGKQLGTDWNFNYDIQPNSFSNIGTPSGYSFTGKFDDLEIWRIAKTQQEILNDFHRTFTGNEPGLIAHWPMNEGQGQTLSDVTGNGHQLELGSNASTDSNDPTWVQGLAFPCLNRGLVAYYPFDNTTDDASGNALNGTVNNAVSTSDRLDTPNSAYGLYSDGDYILVPSNSAIDLSGGDLSISFWVKFNENSLATYPLISSNDDDDGTGFQIIYDSATSQISIWNQSVGGGLGPHVVNFNKTLNEWAHFTLIKKENTSTWYVNGSMLAVVPGNPDFYFSDNSLIIGSYGVTHRAGTFGGDIDEARFYDRALTTQELSLLASSQPSQDSDCNGVIDGLIGYYEFNSITKTSIVHDSSAMGNHGQAIGGVSLTTDRCGNNDGAFAFNGS
ncbi:MAG: LamG domain-containing protein, partial [Desulfobacteraceae bacterium]|nr:LamG domain-containing protein [Desulfobacteraceae bacterium]